MKEKLGLSILILLIILLTSSPFIYGLKDTPSNFKYLGTHYLNSADTFAYYGLFTQAKHGHFLFFNPYTPEKHSPLFFRPSFSLATIFLKILPISSIQIYHIFRILFGFIFLLVLFHFLNNFFPEKSIRYLAYTNLIIGSGLGWISSSFIKDPLDLWIPETSIFLSLMEAPHFMFAMSLMLIIFWLWLKNTASPSIKTTLLASAAAFILFSSHPFDAPLIYLTLFLYLIYLHFRGLWGQPLSIGILFLLFLIISSIPILWQTYLIKSNVIAAYWSKQNINLSPSLPGMIWGIGLWFPLSILGIIHAFRNKNSNLILISLWLISYFFLAYLPLNIQRRFLEGLFMPYIIISCYFIYIILKKLDLKKHNLPVYVALLSVFIFINSFSNLLLLKRDFIRLNQDKKHPFYVKKNIINGLTWLEKNDQHLKTIIANWEVSYLLPTYVYAQTIWGHKVQTIKLFQKEKELQHLFYNRLTKVERKRFFKKYNSKYLMWGESDTTKPYIPQKDPLLKKIYHNPELMIYKII